jgi:hypothetical protein
MERMRRKVIEFLKDMYWYYRYWMFNPNKVEYYLAHTKKVLAHLGYEAHSYE